MVVFQRPLRPPRDVAINEEILQGTTPYFPTEESFPKKKPSEKDDDSASKDDRAQWASEQTEEETEKQVATKIVDRGFDEKGRHVFRTRWYGDKASRGTWDPAHQLPWSKLKQYYDRINLPAPAEVMNNALPG